LRFLHCAPGAPHLANHFQIQRGMLRARAALYPGASSRRTDQHRHFTPGITAATVAAIVGAIAHFIRPVNCPVISIGSRLPLKAICNRAKLLGGGRFLSCA
jgi:hypothetical protein